VKTPLPQVTKNVLKDKQATQRSRGKKVIKDCLCPWVTDNERPMKKREGERKA